MAKTPTKFVQQLSEDQQQSLQRLLQEHPKHRVRQRAQAILLSAQGWSLAEIGEVLDRTAETVSSWLDNWESCGEEGLSDRPRPGGPPKLTEAQKRLAVKLLKKHPHSPKLVLRDLERRTGRSISGRTLRRIARAAGLRWKRGRRSLKSKRDEAEFRLAQEELEEFRQQHAEGEIDLVFLDEAGFSLIPPVPYAWQPVAERLEWPSERSERMNVVGLLGEDGSLHSYRAEGPLDTASLVMCLDDYCGRIERPTVVVLDNAPVHASAEFERHVLGWADRGLTFYFLPPYSPELNRIELLWRMIKYHWLPLAAYDYFRALIKALDNILANVGTEYALAA